MYCRDEYMNRRSEHGEGQRIRLKVSMWLWKLLHAGVLQGQTPPYLEDLLAPDYSNRGMFLKLQASMWFLEFSKVELKEDVSVLRHTDTITAAILNIKLSSVIKLIHTSMYTLLLLQFNTVLFCASQAPQRPLD